MKLKKVAEQEEVYFQTMAGFNTCYDKEKQFVEFSASRVWHSYSFDQNPFSKSAPIPPKRTMLTSE